MSKEKINYDLPDLRDAEKGDVMMIEVDALVYRLTKVMSNLQSSALTGWMLAEVTPKNVEPGKKERSRTHRLAEFAKEAGELAVRLNVMDNPPNTNITFSTSGADMRSNSVLAAEPTEFLANSFTLGNKITYLAHDAPPQKGFSLRGILQKLRNSVLS
jgi:hypothetical protein